MNSMYYRVLVASQRYHKPDPLTYEWDKPLPIGTIVEIPLQKQQVLGVVVESSTRPKFKTKGISSIIAVGAISPQSLKLMKWLAEYYPSPSGSTNGLFVPSYLSGKAVIEQSPTEPNPAPKTKPPKLTSDQARAIKAIESASGHSVLLHGDTGSGKTRVYLDLAQKNLQAGRSVIVLTPEIGLTPQLQESFINSFGDKVFLLHSGMTAKQRRDAWLTIQSRSRPTVVIGPRSALFSPLKNIGLIVLDEMHDSAYKQEQAPYYAASRVAGKLAELHSAKLILGSATPPVADYYVFEQHKLTIVRMKGSAISGNHQVTTDIIDLKDRAHFTKSSWLSNSLLEAIENAVSKKEQVLLFLNRRGTARIILCGVCGWQALCPRCDLSLTYHGDSHRMICHTCGHSEAAPSSCTVCGSSDIIFKSAGTKTIVTELERLFPKSTIKRFDSDLKKSERLQANFESVKTGQVDILVGTQMLGKGLDLPKLSVVGVVLADTSLSFPDYTAEERTYQMLNQVIGRVGRGHRAGRIVLQTYHSDSRLIKQALAKDYENFYEDQIKERSRFGFPPFCYLLKLNCTRRSQAGAQKSAKAVFEDLSANHEQIEIIGPSPAFSEKALGSYTWQLVVKSTKRSRLTDIIGRLPANWNYDIDPANLL